MPTKREAKKFDPEGKGYDYESAQAGGISRDKTHHWPSRDPSTGKILKGRKHKTFRLTRKGEIKAGFKIHKGEDDHYYSTKNPFEDRYKLGQKYAR